MVIRIRKLLAVLLIIGLSFQTAWSMAPACETGGFMAHHSMGSMGVHADTGAESADDSAFEATEECGRMMLRCPAAVLPGGLAPLALSKPGQSSAGICVPEILFLTDAPKRPPRAA